MTLIGSKRHQQSVFEALASSNRAAGSGGGNGFNSLSFLGTGTNLSFTTASATAVVITGCSVTFNLSRTSWVAFSASAISKSSGAGGTFSYMSYFVDGAFPGGFGTIGLWDKGNTGYTCCSIFSTVTLTPLAPGSHTVDLRASCDVGQTFLNSTATLNLFQLAS